MTARFSFNISTFCPHSVFLCFLWIWEQTAIISLYNINWLFYITEISLSQPQASLYEPTDYHSILLRSAHNVYLCVAVYPRTTSNYFPIQHSLTGLYNRDFPIYSPVVTKCNDRLPFKISTFCKLIVLMGLLRNWEQTAVILYTTLLDFFNVKEIWTPITQW